MHRNPPPFKTLWPKPDLQAVTTEFFKFLSQSTPPSPLPRENSKIILNSQKICKNPVAFFYSTYTFLTEKNIKQKIYFLIYVFKCMVAGFFIYFFLFCYFHEIIERGLIFLYFIVFYFHRKSQHIINRNL